MGVKQGRVNLQPVLDMGFHQNGAARGHSPDDRQASTFGQPDTA